MASAGRTVWSPKWFRSLNRPSPQSGQGGQKGVWLRIKYASHGPLIMRVATEETVHSRTVATIAVVTAMLEIARPVGPGVRKAGW